MKGYVPSQHHEAEISKKLARARRSGERRTLATGRKRRKTGPKPPRVSELSLATVLWIRASWTRNGGERRLCDIARILKIREGTISKICHYKLRTDVE